MVLSNTHITDSSIKHLANFSNLETLDLSHTDITDEGIDDIVANFPNLKTLDLSWTHVTDKGVRKLMTLPALYTLELYGTDVTQATRNKVREWRSDRILKKRLEERSVRILEIMRQKAMKQARTLGQPNSQSK